MAERTDTLRSREVRLTRIFGESLSPSHWLVFKSYYLMVQRINQADNIQHWKDAEYCVMMLVCSCQERLKCA